MSTTAPQPRRVSLRFSVRAMLLVTAMIAVWLGWVVNRAQKQKAAVAAIKAADGVVLYDWQDSSYFESSAGWHLGLDDLPPPSSMLNRFLGQDYTHRVRYVAIPEKHVNEETTRHLQGIQGLQTVVVFRAYHEPVELKAALPGVEVHGTWQKKVSGPSISVMFAN